MQSGDLVAETFHRIAHLREAHRAQLFDERVGALGYRARPVEYLPNRVLGKDDRRISLLRIAYHDFFEQFERRDELACSQAQAPCSFEDRRTIRLFECQPAFKMRVRKPAQGCPFANFGFGGERRAHRDASSAAADSPGVAADDGPAIVRLSTIRVVSIASRNAPSGLVHHEPNALRATSRKKSASSTRARRLRPFA